MLRHVAGKFKRLCRNAHNAVKNILKKFTQKIKYSLTKVAVALSALRTTDQLICFKSTLHESMQCDQCILKPENSGFASQMKTIFCYSAGDQFPPDHDPTVHHLRRYCLCVRLHRALPLLRNRSCWPQVRWRLVFIVHSYKLGVIYPVAR